MAWYDDYSDSPENVLRYILTHNDIDFININKVMFLNQKYLKLQFNDTITEKYLDDDCLEIKPIYVMTILLAVRLIKDLSKVKFNIHDGSLDIFQYLKEQVIK